MVEVLLAWWLRKRTVMSQGWISRRLLMGGRTARVPVAQPTGAAGFLNSGTDPYATGADAVSNDLE